MRAANLRRQFVTQPNEFFGRSGFHPKRGACYVVRQISRDCNQCIAHRVGATGNQCDGAKRRIILTLREEQAEIGRGEP